MKLLSFKSIFGEPEGIAHVQALRKSLLNRLMISTCIIGAFLYTLGLIPVFTKGLDQFPVFYTVLYIWLLFISLNRRVPYLIRTGGWLFIFYALGLINLFLNGLNVDAGLFFLSLVAMSALLVGGRAGMAAFLASALTVYVMSFFIITGRFKPMLGLPQTDPIVWIIGSVIFLIMGVVLLLTFTALLSGLGANLESSIKLTNELGLSISKLKESEERYRNLVELSSDMVALVNLDKTIITMNQSGSSLLGYRSTGELAGKNFLSFVAPIDRSFVEAAFTEVLEKGSVRDTECTALKQDGTPFFAGFSASLIVDSAGKPQAVISVGKDITLRKQQELSLQQAKNELEESVALRTTQLQSTSERLEELVERSPAVIYSAQPTSEYSVTTITENVDSLLGYGPEEFHRDPGFWKNHIHAEDAQRVLSEIEQSSDENRVICEYRFQHQNGEYRWIHDERRFVRDANEKLLELVGSWVDITEQKQTEEAYHSLLENSLQGIVVIQNNRIVYINRAFAEHFGYSVDELKALTLEEITNLIHPDDRTKVLDRLMERMGGESTPARYEARVQDRNGGTHSLDVATLVINYGGRPAIQATTIDLTERRRAEETYRALVEQSTLGLVLFQKGKILFCNQAYAEMTGLTVEEILLTPEIIFEYMAPEEQKHITEVREDIFDGKFEIVHYEIKIQRKDGQTHWLEVSAKEIEYGANRTFQAVVIDNTERKLAEDALHYSEARYRTLAEASHDMIFILDREDRIQYVNTFAASQFRTQPEELIGKVRSKLFGSDVSGQQSRSLHQVFETGKPFYAETKTGFPDHNLWLGTWLVPIKDEQGVVTSVMGVSRDISEGKMLEQSLQEAKDLLEQRVAERTAELATGNAQLRKLTHEVVIAQEKERQRVSRQLHDEAGQALIGLRYGMSALLSELPSELFSFRERLDEMIAQADRMTERIRHLAHTLRPPMLEFVGLNTGLEDFCQEFSETTGLSVSYKGKQLPATSEEISISLYRFVQEALTNVLKHAQAGESKVILDYKEETIILYVEDDGKGFAQDSPTKGIGLLGMQERLDLLGGRLEIKSEPGKGTRLTAYVPWPSGPGIANEMSLGDSLD